MAFHTTGALLLGIMEMVFPASIFFGKVTAVTKGIAVHKYLPAMWLMTVGADPVRDVSVLALEVGVEIRVAVQTELGLGRPELEHAHQILGKIYPVAVAAMVAILGASYAEAGIIDDVLRAHQNGLGTRAGTSSS